MIKKKENKGKKSIFGTQQGIAMIVLAILYIFFYIKSTAFRSSTTLASIFDSSYYLSFLAIGVTFTIATGAFDMSIGAVMNTSALIATCSDGFAVMFVFLISTTGA